MKHKGSRRANSEVGGLFKILQKASRKKELFTKGKGNDYFVYRELPTKRSSMTMNGIAISMTVILWL